MFDLAKAAPHNSGAGARGTATLKYVKPFLADKTFDEADAAEISTVVDELDGGVPEENTAEVTEENQETTVKAAETEG